MIQYDLHRDLDVKQIDSTITAVFEREFRALWACVSRSIERSSTMAQVAATVKAPRSVVAPSPSGKEGNSSANQSSVPSASSTAASFEDQLEPFRREQRQILSQVAGLTSQVEDLRTQCGAALQTSARNNEERHRYIAQTLGGFQAQLATLEDEVKVLIQEAMKSSQQTAGLSSSSSAFECRLKRTERGLTAVLGMDSETGLELLDDDVAVEPLFRAWQPERRGTSASFEQASSAESGSPALSMVRDRLLSIRANLASKYHVPATPPPRPAVLPSPVVGTWRTQGSEETGADLEQSLLNASGIHLEVSAPSAPSDLGESPDCPIAPAMPPSIRFLSTSPIAEAHHANPTRGDVALLRRQQEQLQARVDQFSVETLSVQEELASLRGSRCVTESEIARHLESFRASLVEEVTDALAGSQGVEAKSNASSIGIRLSPGSEPKTTIAPSESRMASSPTVPNEFVADYVELKGAPLPKIASPKPATAAFETPSAGSHRMSQFGIISEEPLRKAGSQVGDSVCKASPSATPLKRSTSEKQSPSNGSHCSTPSSNSSRSRRSVFSCLAAGFGGS